MIDYPTIRFGWGGCGNLINYIIRSSDNAAYKIAQEFYCNISLLNAWTSQEWKYRKILGSKLTHDYGIDGINLLWDNTLDTSFHYIIKNPGIDHLSDHGVKIPIHEKAAGVIAFNRTLEDKLKTLPNVWSMNKLLSNKIELVDKCQSINPGVTQERVLHIFELWRAQTRKFYEMHAEQTMKYFDQIPEHTLDYTPSIIYNILYENSNT